jgi:hypothetical protein
MPNLKISELTAVISPSATDVLPIVSNGITKKVALSGVSAMRSGNNAGNFFSTGAASFGVNTIAMGINTLSANSTDAANDGLNSCNNIAIGFQTARNKSGVGINKVQNNVFLGSAIASTTPDIIAGDYGANYNNGMFQNVVIGHDAARDMRSCVNAYRDGCGNMCVYQKNSFNNVVIGTGAAKQVAYMSNNVVIGHCAQINATGNYTCSFNAVVIGAYACTGPQNANAFNIMIGKDARGGTVITQNVIGIGWNPFNFKSDSTQGTRIDDSIAIGNNALGNSVKCTRCSQYDVFIGHRVAYHFAAASNNNVVIGQRMVGTSQFGNVGALSATGNVFIGARALGCTNYNGAARTIVNNTIVGYRGGLQLNGSNNIMIGACTNFNNGFIVGLSGSIVIGTSAMPTSHNQFALGSASIPLSTTATAGSSQSRFLVVNLNGQIGKIQLLNV